MKKRAYPLFFAFNRYIRASVYERTYQKLRLDSLKNIFLNLNTKNDLNSCNFLILDRAKRAKKYYERSEFRVAFAVSKSHENINQKLPQRIERERDSIEFERSENQGQFFMKYAFNYF